jgi:hypothetical protein
MLVRGTHTTLEATRMLNAFVLFRKEGMQAVLDTFPEYIDFVAEHKEWSVRQVKNVLFPSSKSSPTKG